MYSTTQHRSKMLPVALSLLRYLYLRSLGGALESDNLPGGHTYSYVRTRIVSILLWEPHVGAGCCDHKVFHAHDKEWQNVIQTIGIMKAISSKFPNAGLKTCFQNFWEVLISYQKLWEFLGISGKYLEIPRCWTHSASSGISGQFPEFLGNARKFYEVLKSLGISGNFLEAPLCWTHLASFGKFWQFPEFLGRLRSSGNFWKVFGISGKCLEFPR